MEPLYVLPCLDRTILSHILRQRHHKGTALIQHVNFLALYIGVPVRLGDGKDRDRRAEQQINDGEQPDLPETRLDIF